MFRILAASQSSHELKSPSVWVNWWWCGQSSCGEGGLVQNGSVLEPLGKKGPKTCWGRMIDDSQKIASQFYYSYMPEMCRKAIEVCVPGHFFWTWRMIKTCSYVSRSSLTIHEGCSFPVIELFDISGCNQAKMVPAFQKFLLVSMLVKTVPTFVIGFTCSLRRWSWSTLHLGALPC